MEIKIIGAKTFKKILQVKNNLNDLLFLEKLIFKKELQNIKFE